MTSYVKYPRTPHLPWSPGATADDRVHTDLAGLEGREIVVTEKLDGENTTIYRDHVHARSIDSAHHPSRSWVKGVAARVGPLLPEGWRLCGENCYAVHSIAYDDLPDWFVLFSVWDAHDRCLSWDDTVAWAELLSLVTPPVRYRGAWDEVRLRALPAALDPQRQEGFVVRLADAFPRRAFAASMAKWVRPHHVTTEAHWMSKPVVPNGLRGGR